MPPPPIASAPIYLDPPPSSPSVSPKDYAHRQDGSIVPVPTPPDASLAAAPCSNIVNDASERLERELKVEETIDTAGKRRGRFARYMMAELDKETTRIPLAINCFLSGCEWTSYTLLDYLTILARTNLTIALRSLSHWKRHFLCYIRLVRISARSLKLSNAAHKLTFVFRINLSISAGLAIRQEIQCKQPWLSVEQYLIREWYLSRLKPKLA